MGYGNLISRLPGGTVCTISSIDTVDTVHTIKARLTTVPFVSLGSVGTVSAVGTRGAIFSLRALWPLNDGPDELKGEVLKNFRRYAHFVIPR